jgi:osmotically-inducible protein OsmY
MEKPALPTGTPVLAERVQDLDLAERVERALQATSYGALRGLEVTVQAGLVILRGGIPSYYLKQMAQTTVLSVPGVHQLRNDLEVHQSGGYLRRPCP